MKNKASLSFTLLFILLAACSPAPTPASATATLPPPIVTVITAVASETSTLVPVPTLTPTTSPHPMYPYTIDGMRQRDYPGGTIQIVQTLAVYDSHSRYLFTYPSDGLTITGILQIPTGQGPFPVIAMNHGFIKRGEYVSGDGTDRAAGYLVQQGYITIAPDYRSWGASDVGSSFFHTGLVADVLNLVHSLSSLPQADVARVGMWGHSMGGGITTKVLEVDAGRIIRAAVLYAPNSADDADLIARWGYGCIGDISAGEMLETCNSADIIPLTLPAATIEAYKEAAASPDLMREIAPYHHLDLIAAPIQLHIGEADGQYIGATPPEWAYKLRDALLAANRNVDFYSYPGQGHSFTDPDWTTFMQRATAFFDTYVKGSP